ncbi:MAG: heme exporter protein CcmB [Cellvibrionales bacterium]|nr:heme exporter protein CcmB [Cellvibrionales bacterium]
MTPWLAFVKKECLQVIRKPSASLLPIFFSLMVTSLFPMVLNLSEQQLQQVAPAVLIMILLLSALMTTEGLFQADFDDGTTALLFASPHSNYLLYGTKVLVSWFSSGFMLSVFAPVLGFILHMPQHSVLTLFVAFALGSLNLIFLGAVGAALTVTLRNTGMLLIFIILPMNVPVLVLLAAILNASNQGLAVVSNYLALLGALTLMTTFLTPWVISAALKINLESQ